MQSANRQGTYRQQMPHQYTMVNGIYDLWLIHEIIRDNVVVWSYSMQRNTRSHIIHTTAQSFLYAVLLTAHTLSEIQVMGRRLKFRILSVHKPIPKQSHLSLFVFILFLDSRFWNTKGATITDLHPFYRTYPIHRN